MTYLVDTDRAVDYLKGRLDAVQLLDALVPSGVVLPRTRSIVRHFARIRGDLRRRGLIIGDPDILIAATAIHYKLIVVTRNQRHFQRIPAVNLYPNLS
jgi:predicted nucleic acid-binding protein